MSDLQPCATCGRRVGPLGLLHGVCGECDPKEELPAPGSVVARDSLVARSSVWGDGEDVGVVLHTRTDRVVVRVPGEDEDTWGQVVHVLVQDLAPYGAREWWELSTVRVLR
jgi:hypothetical protein